MNQELIDKFLYNNFVMTRKTKKKNNHKLLLKVRSFLSFLAFEYYKDSLDKKFGKFV